jgi:hypothetical protein
MGSVTAEERNEAIDAKVSFVQFPALLMKSVTIGAYLYSGYDAIRSVLHETSGYNE